MFWFMNPIMAACVLLLPLPVTPVTRMSPRSSAATSCTTGGSPSCSSVGISNGITRMTIMKLPRWRRMFTRNRPTPARPHEQS
jgi:hypothetical protein